MGTAIAIAHYLKLYIHNINTLTGTAIMVDIFLPQNTKIRIILTYFPNNNLALLKTTQETLTTWISQAIAKGIHPLILGDFNSNLNRNNRTTSWLRKLQQTGLQSVLETFQVSTPTWHRRQTHSQIDDIWIPQNLIHIVSAPAITDADSITDSDHAIISIKWHIVLLNQKKQRRIASNRLTFKYSEINNDK
jgi:hypothetical protein